MTQHRTATDNRRRRSSQAVAASVRLMLDGSIASAEISTEITAAEVDRTLLEAASAVLTQLRLLGELCQGADHSSRLIMGIVDLAESFGTATPGAIGASGVLVDHLRDPDAARLALVLDSARQTFDDADLIAGATALLTATTSYLADAVGEPPTSVHDEVHRSLGRGSGRSGTNRYCRREGRRLDGTVRYPVRSAPPR